MARAGLPAEVSVQVPPNLAPVREVLDCGVDDLGGVSPVTDDHINPDYAWPAVDELRDVAETADLPLGERLAVHGRYLPADLRPDTLRGDPPDQPQDGRNAADGWISERVADAIRADTPAGERFRAVLAGESLDAGTQNSA
jgi:FO synthase subunit 1